MIVVRDLSSKFNGVIRLGLVFVHPSSKLKAPIGLIECGYHSYTALVVAKPGQTKLEYSPRRRLVSGRYQGMFSLAIIKDKVPVHPQHFGVPPEDAIIAELNKKYANRVLHDVGLCICVFDLSQVGVGRVRYGDGFLWYEVTFRMTVFRPFVSEVMVAKVKSSDEDGIRLTIGFFDDMYIPSIYLPQPSAFDPNERAHFWLPDSELTTASELLDTPTTERMYIDQNEVIRVRVEQDEFFDDEPGPVKVVEGVVQEKAAARPPYTIVCSIAEQGLGPVAWWNGAQAVEGEEAQDMEEG